MQDEELNIRDYYIQAAVLYLFQFITYTLPQKRKKSAQAAEATPAAAEVTSADENEEDDMALIAVLTAAVAAYEEAEGRSGGFRVVSLKRKSGRTSWDGNHGNY